MTALRQRAAELVETELLRLESRLPNLDETHRDEVARTVRRVVDKLLHAPTVRGNNWRARRGRDLRRALRELFELDPQAVDAVAAGEFPPPGMPIDEGVPRLHHAHGSRFFQQSPSAARGYGTVGTDIDERRFELLTQIYSCINHKTKNPDVPLGLITDEHTLKYYDEWQLTGFVRRGDHRFPRRLSG